MANENNNIEESKIKVMGDDYVRIVNAKLFLDGHWLMAHVRKRNPRR